MRKVAVLPSFERSLKNLSPSQRKQVAESLQAFNLFLVTGDFSHGLGFKKINHNKYEFRIDIRLRIVAKLEEDIFYLALVGNHEDVRRYLRNYR